MHRVAILDDYQRAASTSADWSAVRARAAVTVFDDHLDERDALIARLMPFDAICVMRERTPLTAEILAHLPSLRYIGSNGSHNDATVSYYGFGIDQDLHEKSGPSHPVMLHVGEDDHFIDTDARRAIRAGLDPGGP